MIQTITDLPFHPAIARWFNDHFERPSPPQAQGWPAIANGEHTLILAPTGSGKTLSAFLWCIDDLFRAGLDTAAKTFAKNPDGVHTLYISPLKALNNDIERNLQQPLRGINQTARQQGLTPPDIRVLVRTGDTPSSVRQSMVKKPPHILITTPESLYLLLTSAKGREIFRRLRYLIVDEIHAISGNKRGVHLSLSLERLMNLCEQEPVRIGLSATQKPLDRIARFLGGQTPTRSVKTDHKGQLSQYEQNIPSFEQSSPNTANGSFDLAGQRGVLPIQPRPVTIIDCGQRKELDLQVISPVASLDELPAHSIWPAVIAKLYELIRSHRTTLIFVNMRTQTEKVARQLNDFHREQVGDDAPEIALAHHGSISREARYAIEAKLKAGKIPCVVATASLELGIDIGSIDLVVQLSAPQNIASATQRIGRSGHVLSGTSKGRIIPLYPSDIDDCVAIARAVHQADIEESVIPQNCLDVLSQQILAEVAQHDWPRLTLFNLYRQSYCYRDLTETAFNSVVEMLAGRYEDTQLATLRPRLTWDKVNDMLIARRGARLQAISNSGTIPDRGMYGVYIAGSKTKVGEVDEEFTFERRPGEVFFLGNNEWRIEEITPDKVVVTPQASLAPKEPFWRGDPLFRDYATSSRVGAFRREVLAQLELGVWTEGVELIDEAIAENLIRFLTRQRAYTGKMPNDRQIVAEYFHDAAGEPFLMLHAPFGARVNGAWAVALVRAAEQRFEREFQHMFDDDGILIRFTGLDVAPPFEEFLRFSPEMVERLLLEALADTPIFFTYFRHNAGRALLLPRTKQVQRTPLWLQRLRTADLLQAVRDASDFPILIETYREVLENVFDLPNLRQVLRRLNGTHADEPPIDIHVVETESPSPMATELMFRFLSVYLYQYDEPRSPGQSRGVSSALLDEILAQEQVVPIVTPELVAEAEARWQHLTPDTQARDAEEFFAIIEKLGPISMAELAMRVNGDVDKWLKDLREQGRVVEL